MNLLSEPSKESMRVLTHEEIKLPEGCGSVSYTLHALHALILGLISIRSAGSGSSHLEFIGHFAIIERLRNV